ncbi:hypothetical protein [Bradyrhizobium sp. RDI18]|uniref:hypothetical protein n=1 Tax=Bradyrhizobium sp. RDI18 TaxID=3367400 RepID=UPI003712D0F7
MDWIEIGVANSRDSSKRIAYWWNLTELGDAVADFTFRARTAIVGGALAFQMRRAPAARSNECGLQILTIPQLAARLPGGFTTSISSEHLDLAVQRALAEGGFLELETDRYLPGMTRAVSRTLRKVWDADIGLQSKGAHNKLSVSATWH